MDEVLIEMAKQVPAALMVGAVVWMFLKAAEKERAERIANAKEISDVQRAHELQMEASRRGRELEINNLWATTVKNLMATQDTNNQIIVTAIKDMHIDISEQYKNMGITKELYNAAKELLKR